MACDLHSPGCTPPSPRPSPRGRGSVVLALLLFPALALAHGGEVHLSADEVLTWWTWDALALGTLGGSAALYALGVWRLWGRVGAGRGLRAWEVGCFVVGWLALAVALLSPLDALSDILFSAHMSQHELLMLVGAPLLVLGKPLLVYLWALPPWLRERVAGGTQAPAVRATWRWLTAPLVTLVLHALARWLWHVPLLHEAALRSEAVHALQHASFFFTAALFWWALVHGRYGRVGYGVAVLFVFATAAHTGLLGALLTFTRSVWYPLYEERGRAFGIRALEDQQLAGLIMWVPAGTLFTGLGLGLFAAWLGQARRQVAHGRVDALAAAPRGPVRAEEER